MIVTLFSTHYSQERGTKDTLIFVDASFSLSISLLLLLYSLFPCLCPLIYDDDLLVYTHTPSHQVSNQSNDTTRLHLSSVSFRERAPGCAEMLVYQLLLIELPRSSSVATVQRHQTSHVFRKQKVH